MSKGDSITLDVPDQTLVLTLAALRQGFNKVSGVKDAKMSPRAGFDCNLDGIGGELAFAKMRNLCPDFGIGPRSGGHDFTDPELGTVDVKTTPLEHGALLVRVTKANHPSDVYALMTGKFPSYVYRGYASKDEVFLDTRLASLGHGDTYLVPQEDLH